MLNMYVKYGKFYKYIIFTNKLINEVKIQIILYNVNVLNIVHISMTCSGKIEKKYPKIYK